jgi:hypothetical protein
MDRACSTIGGEELLGKTKEGDHEEDVHVGVRLI